MKRFPLPASVPAVFVGGLNYASHAKEVSAPAPKFPIFCMKPATSLLYPPALEASASSLSFAEQGKFLGEFGATVRVPRKCQAPPEVDYEGELAIVIGQKCRNVAKDPKAVEEVLLGFTCALDMSARRWQGKKGGGQWCYAKSFDTFCPMGPDVVSLPLDTLASKSLVTTVNGDVVQKDTFASFIFDVTSMVSFLSESMTLQPGTVILTGTPAGVGFARKTKGRNVGKARDGTASQFTGQEVEIPDPYYLRHKDKVAVTIDDIGSLEVDVVYEGMKD